MDGSGSTQSLDGWIDSYLDHLRVERALAKNTLEAYARDLGEIAVHVDDAQAADVHRIDAAVVLDFVVTASRRGKSARSSARQLSALRGFFRFLVRERAIETDPTELVDRPKLARKLPRVLSYEDVDKILAAPPLDTARGVRDSAMIHLMYASGLRVSELCALKLGDLDRKVGTVAPLGKGSKRRMVPVGQIALDRIDVYLDAVRPTRRARPSIRTSFSRRAASASRARAYGSSSRPTRGAPASSPRSPRTSCGIRSRRTSSAAARTCARCRRCSGTRTWGPPRSTRASRRITSGPPTTRRIRGRERSDAILPAPTTGPVVRWGRRCPRRSR